MQQRPDIAPISGTKQKTCCPSEQPDQPDHVESKGLVCRAERHETFTVLEDLRGPLSAWHHRRPEAELERREQHSQKHTRCLMALLQARPPCRGPCSS